MPSTNRYALLSRYRILVFSVVVLAVTAGCLSVGESSADVTVKNTEPTSYQMSIYVFTEPGRAGNVTFQVTNRTGAQKTVGLAQLDTRGPYYNLSLGEKWNAIERRVSVPANETTTASFTVWDSGKAIVYVFERPNGRVVQNEFGECSRDSLSHTFVFSDGSENGYESSCS